MWKALLFFGFLLVACYAALPGGWIDADVDDEVVVTAAKHASQVVSKKFAGNYHYRLAKVLEAQGLPKFLILMDRRQIVDGMNYQMNIIVGMTTCKKDEVEYEELGDCDFQDGISAYMKCTVWVYTDLKGNYKLVSSACRKAREKEL